uniref:Uncharacterized protein n=1 Tax=Timema genevievae TaxID=629358 RepID=A0A7R9JVV4_TIMGE|nr:unnamed protein product [Timema genevievae]
MPRSSRDEKRASVAWLANAPVVLSQTFEDGEIEVRRVPHSSTAPAIHTMLYSIFVDELLSGDY